MRRETASIHIPEQLYKDEVAIFCKINHDRFESSDSPQASREFFTQAEFEECLCQVIQNNENPTELSEYAELNDTDKEKFLNLIDVFERRLAYAYASYQECMMQQNAALVKPSREKLTKRSQELPPEDINLDYYRALGDSKSALSEGETHKESTFSQAAYFSRQNLRDYNEDNACVFSEASWRLLPRAEAAKGIFTALRQLSHQVLEKCNYFLCGSTLTLAAVHQDQQGKYLTTAQVGDGDVLILTRQSDATWQAQRAVRTHNGERITCVEGNFIANRQHTFPKEKSEDKFAYLGYRILDEDQNRWSHQLSVARAFGHQDRINELQQKGFCSYASMAQYSLSEDESAKQLIITSSDGLSDCLSCEEISTIVGLWEQDEQDNVDEQALLRLSQKLSAAAVEKMKTTITKWRQKVKDNVTVACMWAQPTMCSVVADGHSADSSSGAEISQFITDNIRDIFQSSAVDSEIPVHIPKEFLPKTLVSKLQPFCSPRAEGAASAADVGVFAGGASAASSAAPTTPFVPPDQLPRLRRT